LRDFLIAALLLSLRHIAHVPSSSNPTWTRSSENPKIASVIPYKALRDKAWSMFNDIKDTRVPEHVRSDVIFGDVRDVDLDEKFDAIITSPPYLTRIDYVVNFRMENEFLANLNLPKRFDIGSLRNAMIGTVTITNRGFRDAAPDPIWGESGQKIMQTIERSRSKAARSYYYPNIYAYFDGICRWLRRTRSYLKKNGVMVIVVQSSFFKRFEIPVADIFLQMGRNLGYETISIRHEPIRTHMGLLSPQRRKRSLNKILHEDVLVFTR